MAVSWHPCSSATGLCRSFRQEVESVSPPLSVAPLGTCFGQQKARAMLCGLQGLASRGFTLLISGMCPVVTVRSPELPTDGAEKGWPDRGPDEAPAHQQHPAPSPSCTNEAVVGCAPIRLLDKGTCRNDPAGECPVEPSSSHSSAGAQQTEFLGL